MINVSAWHTMQEVEDEIFNSEGWPQPESFNIYYVSGEVYTATDNVFERLETDDERML